jgi:flagellar motor switch protein FliN/FliY
MADEENKVAAEAGESAAAAAPDGVEASSGAAQAESATATLPPLAPNSGDQTLEAVANMEQQLGDVLANLDGLAGATGGTGLGTASAARGETSIDLLRDVMLNVKIELGRSRMYIEDILKLGEGSVVELDKLAGDPVDVFVNDRLVARGEVLVLNDNFCVRIGEIVAQE